MSHTPGPWEVKIYKFEDGDVIINKVCDTKGNTIRTMGFSLSGGNEAVSNGFLMAAAPELLEALEKLMLGLRCIRGIDIEDYCGEECRNAYEAIAKATKC